MHRLHGEHGGISFGSRVEGARRRSTRRACPSEEQLRKQGRAKLKYRALAQLARHGR
jgi:hypothetical protein